jgi:hypothetical protein
MVVAIGASSVVVTEEAKDLHDHPERRSYEGPSAPTASPVVTGASISDLINQVGLYIPEGRQVNPAFRIPQFPKDHYFSKASTLPASPLPPERRRKLLYRRPQRRERYRASR